MSNRFSQMKSNHIKIPFRI